MYLFLLPLAYVMAQKVLSIFWVFLWTQNVGIKSCMNVDFPYPAPPQPQDATAQTMTRLENHDTLPLNSALILQPL